MVFPAPDPNCCCSFQMTTHGRPPDIAAFFQFSFRFNLSSPPPRADGAPIPSKKNLNTFLNVHLPSRPFIHFDNRIFLLPTLSACGVRCSIEVCPLPPMLQRRTKNIQWRYSRDSIYTWIWWLSIFGWRRGGECKIYVPICLHTKCCTFGIS